ncbi:hypothetical protein AMTR_s00041p00198360 [Amborella trichopoda]|uniref:Uncharacterized protein n=1 Tax=Amborella trichopoda TaxID=13333 RepID=W1PZ71_AMBTC|nr:hypothetical protein AMTR_s00041p00198360 [Amborella trichopoda]
MRAGEGRGTKLYRVGKFLTTEAKCGYRMKWNQSVPLGFLYDKQSTPWKQHHIVAQIEVPHNTDIHNLRQGDDEQHHIVAQIEVPHNKDIHNLRRVMRNILINNSRLKSITESASR